MQDHTPASIPSVNLATHSISPLYDLSFMDEIGNEQFVIEALTIFINDLPAEFNGMLEAAQSSNCEILSQKAHRLKSCVGLIQANGLLRLLEQIEENATSGKQRTSFQSLVEQAIEEYEAIKILLKTHLKQLRNSNTTII